MVNSLVGKSQRTDELHWLFVKKVRFGHLCAIGRFSQIIALCKDFIEVLCLVLAVPGCIGYHPLWKLAIFFSWSSDELGLNKNVRSINIISVVKAWFIFVRPGVYFRFNSWSNYYWVSLEAAQSHLIAIFDSATAPIANNIISLLIFSSAQLEVRNDFLLSLMNWNREVSL